VEHEFERPVEGRRHGSRQTISQRPQSFGFDAHYIFTDMFHEGRMLAEGVERRVVSRHGTVDQGGQGLLPRDRYCIDGCQLV
jgi:hypothetical protein